MTLTVNNDLGEVSSEIVTVNIIDVNDNSPIINDIREQVFVVEESGLFILGTINATDADVSIEFRSLTYSSNNDLLSITDEGVISFSPPVNIHTPIEDYQFTLSVNDGIYNFTQIISVSVNNTDGSTGNRAPSLSSLPNIIDYPENSGPIITIQGTDLDNNPLTYSVISNASVTITADGILSFTS